MTDFVALAVLLLVIAAALALASRRPLAWAIEEWRLMRAETWQGEQLVNPRLVDDERAALLVVKQRAMYKRLRRQGRSLFTDKPYTPVLTKPVETPPPRADKVVPIRRVA